MRASAIICSRLCRMSSACAPSIPICIRTGYSYMGLSSCRGAGHAGSPCLKRLLKLSTLIRLIPLALEEVLEVEQPMVAALELCDTTDRQCPRGGAKALPFLRAACNI